MTDMPKIVPPRIEELEGEPDWTPVDMPFSATGGSSFVDGDPDGLRLRLRMFFRESDKHLFTRVWFGPEAEGPPRHAHGGSMAAVLDHTMGVGAWVSGIPVLAASITINFHRKLPIGTIATSETWVSDVEDRKVFTVGFLYGEDPEKPFATGEGLFIQQELDKFAGLVGEPGSKRMKMRELKDHMRP
jgi:acyl-coenzyme A thioesterase PaaI-like protein